MTSSIQWERTLLGNLSCSYISVTSTKACTRDQGSTTLVAMLDKYLFIHSLATRLEPKSAMKN